MSRPCPCTSKKPYDRCCGPFHTGTALPETAEALMRSRFSAYALGKVDYLISTRPEAKRAEENRDELRQYCQSVSCVGLKIVSREKGGKDDDTGVVTFHASLQANGRRTLHIETSTFTREDGRWVYVDGVVKS
ncbi:YchJ family protein [Geothrix fermentans]|jgi:SEC-C motif-containing protein|uniref:YchJ family protein n=1 Tax=Geothrix fermentans TaxID=44676 RepID=UPI0004037C69|nr:YchJ family protein [Geothrix fermentans]